MSGAHPVHAAIPVVGGIVVAACAMSAAWAMSTAIRPDHQIYAAPSLSPAAVIQAHAAVKPVTVAEIPLTFLDPLPGYAVNSPFGLRRMPWEEGGRLHEGVDIAAPGGSAVGATADGVVVSTGDSPSYGRYVELRHEGGLSSFYAHLGRVAPGVVAGTPVRAGQAVAFVGNSGRSTGSHLHFEIRQDDTPLNPALFMGKTFASIDDLPISAAAKVSNRVRMAVVSRWPSQILKAREDRIETSEMKVASVSAKDVNLAASAPQASMSQPSMDGRVRMVIQPSRATAEAGVAVPSAPTVGPAPLFNAPKAAVVRPSAAPASVQTLSVTEVGRN